MSTSAPSRVPWWTGAGPEPVPGCDAPAGSRGQAGLPALYLITPQPGPSDAQFLRDLGRALDTHSAHAPLVQFRAHGLPRARWRALAGEVLRVCRARRVRLLLGAGGLDPADPRGLQEIGADGLHLPSRLLMAVDRQGRPPGLLAASCHDVEQLRQAEQVGADFVTVSPVLPTASHPGAPVLGWSGLRRLCAATTLPVYALGGLTSCDDARARAAGAHGVAGIRALWVGQAP